MSASDHPARQAQEALFDAYVSATGLPVHLSHSRRFDLQKLVECGVTPDELRAVLRNIQRKMARAEGGYTETSLLWRNAMNPDAMEENVQLFRQAKARAKGARPKPAVPRTDTLADGSTVSRLDDAAAKAIPSLKDMVAEAIGRNP